MTDSTVGAGQTYTTLQAWEDAAPATLTSIWRGIIQANSDDFDGSTSVLLTMAGSTSTASLYKELTVLAGESFVDHASASTNALDWNTANGASLTTSKSYGGTVAITEPYARIKRIMVRNTSTGGRAFETGSGTGIEVDQCIFDGNRGAAMVNVAAPGIKVSSSLFIQRASAATSIIRIGSGSSNFYNCTFVVPSGASAATNCIDESYASGTLKSCAMFGVTGVSDDSGMSYTTCHTDSADVETGVTSSLTYANQFENTTNDWRVKSGADLIDGGTYDATNAPVDIIDTAFGSGTTDSGCWEFVSGAILLAGDATAIATSTGDLRIGVQFAGDATAIATSTGELTVDITLSGDATAIATSTGDLRIGVQFAGDATAIATATGDLSLPGQLLLSGDATAIATSTGDLRIGVQLDGGATAIATATGSLTVGIQLAGDATVITTATGDLTTALLEEIIAMAADSQGKKKSDFPALNSIPSDATFDFVSNGANYKIPVADFLSSLSVTGTIVQDGDVTGVPVLDTAASVHRIRNIEPGAGINASVSAENGLALTHAFLNGSGGVPLLTDLTTTPTVRNLVAGTGITLTEVAGGVVISLT